MRNAAALAAAILSAALLLWSFGAGTAVSGAATGLVRAVAGRAFVIDGWRRTILAAGARLHIGDTLQAGRDGPFQITFAGDVILTVAAGARITLSRSVFDKAAKEEGPAVLIGDAAREITAFIIEQVLPENRQFVPAPSIGVRG